MTRRMVFAIAGWLAMVIGLGAVAVTIGTVLHHSLFSAETSSGSWDARALYISSAAGPGAGPSCTIEPKEGRSGRTVSLPEERQGRGFDLRGRTLSRWFTGTASVRCTGPVRMSSQPWAVGYWLAERTWMIIPAVLLAVFGWVIRPERRR